MRSKGDIPAFKVWFAFVALFTSIVFSSCKKMTPQPEGGGDDEAILYPYRLNNVLQDQSTLMPRSVFIDSKQNKWITYKTKSGLTGIIRFDGNTGDVFPNPSTPLPIQFSSSVTAHAEDANGAIYFTSNSGDFFNYRLYRFHEGSWSYWTVSGVPCRELYFNTADEKLYFVYLDEVHRISTTADFTNAANYEKLIFELPGDPFIIQSSFDGKEIHLLSNDRYYVINPQAEVVFYTTKFNEISFDYIYAADTSASIFALGGPSRQHLYKLHEGRWARYPLSNMSLSSITVDHDDIIYVNAAEPDYSVGRYQEGSITFFSYGDDKKRVISSAPVVIDNRNVKWAAVSDGIVRLP
jgi:hypothetical protein